MESLKALVSGLTKFDESLSFSSDEPFALDLPGTLDPNYIWPNLVRQNIVDGSHLFLIVAAGAVGKSAAAKAMSDFLGWPLVDAARAQVGSYSLSGLLHDALGFDSKFIADVARGDAGVVIDALDEAHLRAGTSNFQAFLENVFSSRGSQSRAAFRRAVLQA